MQCMTGCDFPDWANAILILACRDVTADCQVPATSLIAAGGKRNDSRLDFALWIIRKKP